MLLGAFSLGAIMDSTSALLDEADREVQTVVMALGPDAALAFYLDALKQHAPSAFEMEEIDLEDFVEFLALEDVTQH